MAEPSSPQPFDTPLIEHLVALMGAHDLSEIDLHDGGSGKRIRLRRGTRVVATALPAAPAPLPATAAMSAPTPAASEASKPASTAYHEITSPMVGTFYAKPGPDKEDYVKAGSPVKPDTVVCKLEAMKLFNDLPAECTGTIREVCVKNGQAVDFGTVLFRVELT